VASSGFLTLDESIVSDYAAATNNSEITTEVIMKICTECLSQKELTEFYKHKQTKDGYRSVCKDCNRILVEDYRKTKDGLISVLYSSQKYASIKRNQSLPIYTKSELTEWLNEQPLFHKLYTEWVLSGYDTFLKPSIDRKSNLLSYTFENIKLMVWQENKNNAYEDMRTGKLKNSGFLYGGLKAVSQYSLGNTLIQNHISVSAAAKEVGVVPSNISACCSGRQKTAKDFIWRYSL